MADAKCQHMEIIYLRKWKAHWRLMMKLNPKRGDVHSCLILLTTIQTLADYLPTKTCLSGVQNQSDRLQFHRQEWKRFQGSVSTHDRSVWFNSTEKLFPNLLYYSSFHSPYQKIKSLTRHWHGRNRTQLFYHGLFHHFFRKVRRVSSWWFKLLKIPTARQTCDFPNNLVQ